MACPHRRLKYVDGGTVPSPCLRYRAMCMLAGLRLIVCPPSATVRSGRSERLSDVLLKAPLTSSFESSILSDQYYCSFPPPNCHPSVQGLLFASCLSDSKSSLVQCWLSVKASLTNEPGLIRVVLTKTELLCFAGRNNLPGSTWSAKVSPSLVIA